MARHGTGSGTAIGPPAHRPGGGYPHWGARWRAVAEPAGDRVINYLFNNYFRRNKKLLLGSVVIIQKIVNNY